MAEIRANKTANKFAVVDREFSLVKSKDFDTRIPKKKQNE